MHFLFFIYIYSISKTIFLIFFCFVLLLLLLLYIISFTLKANDVISTYVKLEKYFCNKPSIDLPDDNS